MDNQILEKQKNNQNGLPLCQNQEINSLNYKELYESEHILRLNLQKQLEIQRIKVKKLLNGKIIKGKICPKCLSDVNQSNLVSEDLVQDFKQFSQNLSSRIKKKQIQHQKQQKIMHSASSPVVSNANVPIIQNFTVFGLSQLNIINQKIKSHQQLGGQILYSLNSVSQLQKQAKSFIFPSGVAIKKLYGSKAKDKAIQIMSSCYTNLKSFVLKSPNEQFPSEHYEKNQLLNHVNKQKNLFFICIGIKDYTWIENNNKNITISLNNIVEDNQLHPNYTSEHQIISDSNQHSQPDSADSSFKSLDCQNQSIALSQRVFCITSYFPFFTFFQQILRSLVNNVKMERLHLYKLNSENIQQTVKQTDSRYQLSRISQLFILAIDQIINKKIQLNRSYEIKLINQQKITLLTDWNYAKTYFIDQWIFTILSMFNFDSFLDLWTELFLAQGRGIVFVCQNSHILTYTVYLFGNILVKPFKYPYPVVNIVPEDQDFLDSPFPVIYGMFKKRKYVEQHQIIQRYNDRTYAFLNPEKVEIVFSSETKKSIQRSKPPKLRNDLSMLFKDLKNLRKKESKTAKYQIQTKDYSFLSKKEEREKSVQIVAKVHEYIQKQIVNKIPTKIQVSEMSKKIQPQEIPDEKTFQTVLLSKVINSIKKGSKDPFFERFLQTQMFSNYLLGE